MSLLSFFLTFSHLRYDVITHAILSRGIELMNVDRFPVDDDVSINGLTDEKFFEWTSDGSIAPKVYLFEKQINEICLLTHLERIPKL